MYDMNTFISERSEGVFEYGTAIFDLQGTKRRVPLVRRIDRDEEHVQIILQTALCEKVFEAVHEDGSVSVAEFQTYRDNSTRFSSAHNIRNPNQKKVVEIRYKESKRT